MEVMKRTLAEARARDRRRLRRAPPASPAERFNRRLLYEEAVPEGEVAPDPGSITDGPLSGPESERRAA